tara:strand:- start:8177 stop:9637 length:1461 start_codon:yes stop_codon:yes gene_type:complete
VCGLFEKPSLLWCTERELQAILQGPQEFKAILGQHSQQDKIRLQHVWQKRSNLLWYESDVCLGLKVLSDKKLAWGFQLQDFYQEHQSSQIAIAASLDFCHSDKMNRFDQKSQDSSLERNLKNCCHGIKEPFKACSYSKMASEFFSDKNVNLGMYHDLVTISLIKKIAPHASIHIVPVVNRQGIADEHSLLREIKQIKPESFDIIHVGLQIIEPVMQSDLEQELCKHSYVVAPAGNQGQDRQEAYPASSSHVFFSVGAIDWRDNICSFSQYTKNIGPNFAAPGLDILCPIHTDKETIYYVVSGTSISAAFITGFLALLIPECKNKLSYNQIIRVIQATCIQQQVWQGKVALGAIDMRSALFCVQVLAQIQKAVSHRCFNKQFDKILTVILYCNNLHEIPNVKLLKIKDNILQHASSLQKLIDLVVNMVLQILSIKQENKLFKNLFDKDTLCLVRNSIDCKVNNRLNYLPKKERTHKSSLSRQKKDLY